MYIYIYIYIYFVGPGSKSAFMNWGGVERSNKVEVHEKPENIQTIYFLKTT